MSHPEGDLPRRIEPGRVLAIDYGQKRVGLAVSDPLRITAQPLEVVAEPHALSRVLVLISDLEISELVIGLPVSLSGREGTAATAVRDFSQRLAEATGVPITLVDERFTTTTAEAAMLEGGVKRAQRRRSVDKVAAAVILQMFLDQP